MLKTDRFISTSTGSDLGLGVEDLAYDPDFNSPTNPTTSWLADHNHNRSSALFGNLDYDITRQIEVSLALRYDRDHRRQIVDSRQSAGLPAGCSAANVAGCTKEATFSAWQPKISLRYKASDASLLYASYGEGFRSGQFNQSGVGAAAAAASPPVNGVADQIGAETVRSFELGYKTTLAGGSITLNSSLFHTLDNNAPYFVFIGAGRCPSAGADQPRQHHRRRNRSHGRACPGLDRELRLWRHPQQDRGLFDQSSRRGQERAPTRPT